MSLTTRPGRAVYRYRCANLADVLRAHGWQVDVVWIGDRRVRVDHEVVVLHRICAVAEGRAYARAARARGATLVYGTDDLVFDADAFLADDPAEATARLRRYAPLHAAMAQESRCPSRLDGLPRRPRTDTIRRGKASLYRSQLSRARVAAPLGVQHVASERIATRLTTQ